MSPTQELGKLTIYGGHCYYRFAQLAINGSINHLKQQGFSRFPICHERHPNPNGPPVSPAAKRPANLPLLWKRSSLLLALPLRIQNLPGMHA